MAEQFYPEITERDRVGSLRDLDMAILIDDQTFSTAEILAEILRRLNPERVVLVGKRTYGKWSAQTWFPFVDDEGNNRRLIYTTMLYAPGADTAPPKHVIPDIFLDYTLETAREAGAMMDTAYRVAVKKLTRMSP